jgi:hypothetical protein
LGVAKIARETRRMPRLAQSVGDRVDDGQVAASAGRCNVSCVAFVAVPGRECLWARDSDMRVDADRISKDKNSNDDKNYNDTFFPPCSRKVKRVLSMNNIYMNLIKSL